MLISPILLIVLSRRGKVSRIGLLLLQAGEAAFAPELGEDEARAVSTQKTGWWAVKEKKRRSLDDVLLLPMLCTSIYKGDKIRLKKKVQKTNFPYLKG